jgi:putative solute:sodium symporter small subunit
MFGGLVHGVFWFWHFALGAARSNSTIRLNLGFWFAQQGSIICFVVLIFYYAWRMNQIDREHGVDEE